MNDALRALLRTMLNQKIIGGKHTPEKKLVLSKTRWLEKKDMREFMDEYKDTLSKSIILRCKKRTGKNYDWHISLNPSELKRIYEMIA